MFLCIDTATEVAGVAIVGKTSVYLPLEARHASDKILEIIDQVIQKADVKLSDLKGVFVVKGPGSFTGLRVGIAVANQFAHQLKIPIVGLKTDEWHRYQTDENNFIYLQSMNRDQVYRVGFGKSKRDFPQSILSISECHSELVSQSDTQWLGRLSEDHQKHLSDVAQIKVIRNPEETWLKVVQNITMPSQKNYELVEPFYGKEPTITKSKRKLAM